MTRLLNGWRGEPIVSSVLIEVPGPEGDQEALWFVRTTAHAYFWQFKNGETDDRHAQEPILPQKYDEAFETMSSWEQAPPTGGGDFGEGYYGFLSLYGGGKSWQMLLTVDELRGESDGRLLRILEKLLENRL